MSTTFDSIHQKRIYYRVRSPFPGINVWLTPDVGPEARRGNESATVDTANTSRSRFCKRVMGLGAKKAVSAAHDPRSALAPAANKATVLPSDGLEASAQSTAYQLTDLENEYLEYVKKGIGRGDFAHYRMPSH